MTAPKNHPPLTKAYKTLFDEISEKKDLYASYSVAGFYVDQQGKPNPEKINVIIRIDVDDGFHLTVPLAEELHKRGLNASHYFLTFPERYYNVWGSGIPKKVAELGQEVGLHTDHYYEEKTKGIDGKALIKEDVRKLSEEAGHKIRGFVYHGHPDMNALGVTNWDLTKYTTPEEFDLEYHDGLASSYIKPLSRSWAPKADIRISDFLGVPYSWGWNYWPSYPMNMLKKAKPGDIAHIAIHTRGAFEYWKDWPEEYGETKIDKESPITFLGKTLYIRARRLAASCINKRKILEAMLHVVALFFTYVIGLFVSKEGKMDHDSDLEVGRKRIYDLGIEYWEKKLDELGVAHGQDTIIEVGSGTGQWLLAASPRAKNVIGFEPHADQRVFAERKFKDFPERAKNVTLNASVAEFLNQPDQSVDTVLCLGVFMFTDQDRAIQEMKRVLKPDGQIIIDVNGIGYLLLRLSQGMAFKNIAKVKQGLAGLFATWLKWSFGKKAPFGTSVSAEEIKKKFADNGIELTDVKVWNQFEYFPMDVAGWPTNLVLKGRLQPESNRAEKQPENPEDSKDTKNDKNNHQGDYSQAA